MKLAKEDAEDPSKQSARGCVRFVIVGLLFFAFAIQFGMRAGLPLTIIAMTTKNTSSNPNIPVYNWDNSSVILSAIYWAYPILQFMAGSLINRFGSRRLLLLSVFGSSLAYFSIPLGAAYFSSAGVIVLRVLQGLFQGFVFPCLNGALGRWLPPNELSVGNSIVHSGLHVGLVLMRISAGYWSASSWGWPSTFYIPGGIGLVWCVFWAVLSADTPATHPFIHMEERLYIEKSLGQENDHLLKKKPPIPWSAIVSSVPYWAIVVATTGESWLSTYSTTQLSSYLSYAVGLDIVKNGLVSAASTGISVISIMAFGFIASYSLKMNCMSIANSRRLFLALSQYSYIIMLLAMSFTEDPATVIWLYILSSLFSGGKHAGLMVNCVDLSPRFASTLNGVANGTGQVIAIFAPLLVQFMVTDRTNKDQWRTTFYLASAIGAFGTTFFVFFCSGERQWWDDVSAVKSEDDAGNEDVEDEVETLNKKNCNEYL